MGLLRQLAGQTAIYGVSSILGRSLNFLLVPLYTRVLDPGEYGVVTDLYAWVAFLMVLYAFGFETTYFRFAAREKTDPGKYFRLAQTSLVITSVFFSSLLILLADPIASALQYPGKGIYIVWLALIMGIDALVAVPFAKLRLEKKATKFAMFKLVNISVNIGLNLFFLVFCPWWLSGSASGWFHDALQAVYVPQLGVGYIFLANLIANAFFLVFFYKDLLGTKLKLNREWLPMIAYATPLMIIGLAGVTNEMLSRTILKYLLPEDFYPGRTPQEALGIFGACYKLSVFMTLSIQAFRYAFEPFFFSASSGKNSTRLFSDVMHGFIIFGAFAWLVISILLPDIAPVVLRRESYLEGLEVVPWLLGGGLFLGIYYNLSVWYKLTDKNRYGAIITIAGALVTIVLNIALIPVMGYMGSAVTTFVSYLSMVVISFWLGQKHYFIPYRVAKGTFYILLAAGLILAFYFWGINLNIRYLIAAGFIVMYIVVVWISNMKEGLKSTEQK